MGRILALALWLAICFAAAACGGDDDGDSQTDQPDSSSGASGDAPTDTAAAEGWSGELSGPISGPFENPLAPQCGVGDDAVAISLQGIVADRSVVVSIFASGPGTFDFTHPSDESPTVDIATGGDPPAEWFGAAGTSGSGEVTLEDDGSGSANVTIPTIVTGNQEDITLTAVWVCPAQ